MARDVLGIYLAKDKSDSGDGDREEYLEPGIYFVDVVDSSNIGSAEVTVLATLDKATGDYKTEADLTLDSSTSGGMIRGGRWVKCNFSTSPTSAISVLVSKASD